ncbi:MAG: hypothetical protein ACAH80_00155 [Alphaproteobacteria bacterium]
MTFAVREELAKSFLEAADEIAGAAEREAAAQEKQQRAALKAKLGRIVDDYERELEPLVKAIGMLPAKDGGRFEIKNAAHRGSSVSMDVQVLYTQGGKTSGFKIDAMTTIDGEDRFSLTVEPLPPQIKNDASAAFAQVRKGLAYWFATVAPERLPELKDIMMPDTSMALGRDMKASSPLRLKPSS